MTGFTTCLWFDKQGEEAAKYYTSIFPNSTIGRITYVGETGPQEAGSVMAVEFELDGQKFLALNGGPDFTFSEAISFQIPCETQADVDEHWDKFIADGGVEGPCGWLKDKFGLSWQIVPNRLYELMNDSDPKKAAAATKAMFAMKKIVIADLEKAYESA